MLRRLVTAGLAAALLSPVLVATTPASAAVSFSCNELSAVLWSYIGLSHTRQADVGAIVRPGTFGGCDNGQSAGFYVGGYRYFYGMSSFPSRPLGCPVALGGAAGNDYADQTPILLSWGSRSVSIAWSNGYHSEGIAKVKSAGSGTPTLQQWRLVFVITNGLYTSHPGQKTKIKGLVNWVPVDTYTCVDDSDPINEFDLSLPAGGALIAQQK